MVLFDCIYNRVPSWDDVVGTAVGIDILNCIKAQEGLFSLFFSLSLVLPVLFYHVRLRNLDKS